MKAQDVGYKTDTIRVKKDIFLIMTNILGVGCVLVVGTALKGKTTDYNCLLFMVAICNVCLSFAIYVRYKIAGYFMYLSLYH